MASSTWDNLDPTKQARIIQASAREFGSHAYTAGSLNVIAREAGIAKGSLFQYFDDKLGLYLHTCEAVTRSVQTSLLEQLAPVMSSGLGFFDMLKQLFVGWMAYTRNHELERQVLLVSVFETDDDIRRAVRAIIDPVFVELINGIVDAAIDHGELDETRSLDHLRTHIYITLIYTMVVSVGPEFDPFLSLHSRSDDELMPDVECLLAPFEGWYAGADA